MRCWRLIALQSEVMKKVFHVRGALLFPAKWLRGELGRFGRIISEAGQVGTAGSDVGDLCSHFLAK